MKINNRIYPTLTLEEQALFRKITNEYTFTYNVMLEIGTKKLSFWQMAWLRRKLFKFYKKDINRIRKYIKARKKYEKEHPAEETPPEAPETVETVQEPDAAHLPEETPPEAPETVETVQEPDAAHLPEETPPEAPETVETAQEPDAPQLPEETPPAKSKRGRPKKII